MDPARLKKIPVFADLSDEELGHIAALAAEVSVPESKELVREGDYSYDVLAIEEGTARVERHGENIADLGPGDVFGEMGVLERSQRNATVVATSPMLLVTLTSWDIRRLQKTAPKAVDRTCARWWRSAATRPEASCAHGRRRGRHQGPRQRALQGHGPGDGRRRRGQRFDAARGADRAVPLRAVADQAVLRRLPPRRRASTRASAPARSLSRP